MTETKRTKSGWMVTTTNTLHGMLEAGGVAERKVLYKEGTLRAFGIDPESDPEGAWNDYVTRVDYLLHCVPPDRVLSRGREIF